MNPTQEQIRTITDFDYATSGIFALSYDNNLTELNRVWAKVCKEILQ